jgi:hypothetical protein
MIPLMPGSASLAFVLPLYIGFRPLDVMWPQSDIQAT